MVGPAHGVRPAALVSQWCGWVRDCNFVTYQPGATTANWSPNKGGSSNTYVDLTQDPNTGQLNQALALPYVSGTQQQVNFGPYDPRATYAYTLSFDARALAHGDNDAQLYVGFIPDYCNNNTWFRIYTSSGWQHYSITNQPIYVNNPNAPPPAVCFLNEYGDHATVVVMNPTLTIAVNGHIIPVTPTSGTIPWHPHHSVRLSDHSAPV